MKIDMPVKTVLKLERLLKFMALAHKEMGEDDTNKYCQLYFDTDETVGSDPREFEFIDKSIFKLSDEIRQELRFI